jgi:hypothetical protein
MDTPSDTAAPQGETPHPAFPIWPFSCMAYADHIGRDYRQHLAKLGQAATGVEMVQSESLYDAHLFSDLTRAFCTLALAPYSALWAVASGETPSMLMEGLDTPESPAAAAVRPSRPGVD